MVIGIDKMRRVVITDIHFGNSERGLDKYTYACLRDASTKELLIGASLDYVLMAVKDKTREYQLVKGFDDGN